MPLGEALPNKASVSPFVGSEDNEINALDNIDLKQNSSDAATTPLPSTMGETTAESGEGRCVTCPHQGSFFMAAQLLSVVAFLISWIWWPAFLVGTITMILLQVNWCRRMQSRGVYTVAAFSMVTALLNWVIGVWYIVTPDEGVCRLLTRGPWYEDDVIEPSDWCHDLWGVVAIVNGILWMLVAYFTIAFAPLPGRTTSTIPNEARQKICACFLYRDRYVILIQVLSIFAFLLSFVWWFPVILGGLSMVFFQTLWCCRMERGGMATAIVLAYLSAVLCLFTGLWMIFQHKDGRVCYTFYMIDGWEEVEEGGLDGYVSEYGDCPYELLAILSFVASLLWIFVGSLAYALLRSGRLNNYTARDREGAKEERSAQEQPAQV